MENTLNGDKSIEIKQTEFPLIIEQHEKMFRSSLST
jgi:hypothetical protein